MTYRLWAAILLTMVVPAAELRGEDAQKDLDKLQGTWPVTAMERNGKLEAISRPTARTGRIPARSRSRTTSATNRFH